MEDRTKTYQQRYFEQEAEREAQRQKALEDVRRREEATAQPTKPDTTTDEAAATRAAKPSAASRGPIPPQPVTGMTTEQTKP